MQGERSQYVGIPAPTPGLAQLDTDLQNLTKQLAQLGLTLSVTVNLTGILLLPVTPPSAPASGSIIYVSNVDNHTYVVNAAGTRTQIAP